MDTITLCFLVINGASALSSILTNIPVFVSIWRTPRLHTPSFVLISSLAVSDFGVGLLVQPLFIAFLLNQDHISTQRAYQAFAMYFLGASITTMAAIAVDRCSAILLHMRYQEIVTTKRAVILMVTSWVLNTLLLIPYAFVKWKIFQFIVAALTSLCIIIVAICYYKILRIVRRHRREIEIHKSAINAPVTRHGRSLTTMFYLHGFYALSIIPMAVYLVYSLIWKYNNDAIWRATVTCALLNSTVNPYLGVWRMNELRNAVKKMFREPMNHILRS